MPKYEYQHLDKHGPNCESVFSVQQKITDTALTSCPICFEPCKKMISAPNLGGLSASEKSRGEALEKKSEASKIKSQPSHTCGPGCGHHKK